MVHAFLAIDCSASGVVPRLSPAARGVVIELRRCPIINEVQGLSDGPTRDALVRKVQRTMWRIAKTDSGGLSEAIHYVFSGSGGHRENDTRARLNEIWVDRFLFDPPPFVDHAPFFPFSRALDGSLSPMFPVRVDADWCYVYPLDSKGPIAPPTNDAEFRFYVTHFPRRVPDSADPAKEFVRLKPILSILDACPSPLADWQPEDGRAERFALVERSMAALRKVPTEKLHRSVLWLYKRRRRAYYAANKLISLPVYLRSFPLNPSPRDGDDEHATLKRIIDHAEEACRNEMWVDRFLFQTPKREKVHRLTTPYPWKNVLPVWWPRGPRGLKEGDVVDRLYPLIPDSRTFRLAPDFSGVGPALDREEPEGEEFEYYSRRYPRRKLWRVN